MIGIARIFSLRAVGNKEILTGDQARLLQNRQDDVARRSWIGRAFEDDQLPRSQVGGDLASCRFDVAQIGIAAVGQRCWDADQNRIGFAHPLHVGRWHERLVSNAGRNPLAREMLDVALAGQQSVDLARIDVKSVRCETRIDKGAHQRQSDVAQANDPNGCRLVRNRGCE